MRKIEAVIKKISSILHIMAAVILFIIIMCVVADVLLRFLKLPAIGDMVELTAWLGMVLTFLAMGFLVREGKHISVDIVTSRVSSATKRLMSMVSGVLSILFCLLMGYEGIVMVIGSYKLGQHLQSWEFAVWPFQVVVPLGFLAFALERFFVLTNDTINVK